MLKKLSIGAYINCAAAVFGLVGVIALIVGSTINSAYAYKDLGLLVCAGICGIVLVLAAIWSQTRFGNHDYISTFAAIGAIALYMYVIGAQISDRILMIAGLFSYNSQNMVGWSVFYAMVVSAVGFIGGSVLVIVSSFLRGAKN